MQGGLSKKKKAHCLFWQEKEKRGGPGPEIKNERAPWGGEVNEKRMKESVDPAL